MGEVDIAEGTQVVGEDPTDCCIVGCQEDEWGGMLASVLVGGERGGVRGIVDEEAGDDIE